MQESIPFSTEQANDPWQAAFDAVFAEKFSDTALEEQRQTVKPLREEAVSFLSLAENMLGFQAMQQYAAAMCANHPHLAEGVQEFMGGNHGDDHGDTLHAHMEHGQADEGDDDTPSGKKKKKRSQRLGFFAFLLARE